MNQRHLLRLSLLLSAAFCILFPAADALLPTAALAASAQTAVDPAVPKEAGDMLILTSWIAAVYFVSGFIAGVVVLIDAWGWISDKATARKWAYLCVVTSVFGAAAYLVWKKRSRQEDRHRLFCMSCGSYFEGGPGLCPHCGAPTAGGGRSRIAQPL